MTILSQPGDLASWLIALLIGVALASAAWLLARRRARARLRSMIAGAERLAFGDLAYGFDETLPGEHGRLARALNRMLIDLKRSDRELDELIGHLDVKVAATERESDEFRARLVAAQKVALMGRLAELFASELDNPLLGVFTYVRSVAKRLRQNGDPASRDMLRFLLAADRELERTFRVARSLSDLMRRAPASSSKVDLGALIEEALLILQHRCEIMNVAVEAHVDPALTVQGHRAELEKAFLALLFGAMQRLAPRERRALQISSRLDERGRVRVVFKDNGVDLAPAELDRTLEPVFVPERDGGTMGMALVKEIVTRHGGTLEVASAAGMGTTATIELSPAG